ncbi:hypothetical protein [Cochleicola gelatinilyticus]|uniref:Uncharacterized protein n=1 Tax=Cochleicola gelatinilyticus TaxID=1763537 RepID=A0A167KBA0_9FLAO|nr:hypothetical protein [Cochleicola gelatinilyticus]OAB81685.1 hypothetical protein ULVI_00915 [Cochleicola gelatinilyticus]
MRSFAILFLLTFFSCSEDKKSDCNYITDYYQSIYKADYEFQIKNYEKAFEFYQMAFKSCEPITTPTYNEIGKFAETTAILKKYDLTLEYAKKLILSGRELTIYQNNPNFNEFMTSKYGQLLEQDYDKLREQFMENVDFNLRHELIAMKAADQKYRVNRNIYENNRDKQDSIDKVHEKRLIELFESIGYPNNETYGPFSLDHNHIDIGLFLLHTDDSIRMNYFVPKVKEFVKNGKATPRTLGTMIDQFYLYNGEPQIYGTYTKQDGGYENMIDDLKKVDSNRISIGLPPLDLKDKKLGL